MTHKAVSCFWALVQGPLFLKAGALLLGQVTASALALLASPSPSLAASITSGHPHPLALEDFAAVELNGRQISRGSLFFLHIPGASEASQGAQTDHASEAWGCWLEKRLLEKELHADLLKSLSGNWLRLPAEACKLISEETRLMVTLAPAQLKEQRLQFGRAGLSAAEALNNLRATNSSELPSAHLDVFRSRHTQQLGLGVSYGPAQFLAANGNTAGQSARYSLEWLFESGAALQLGDLTSEAFNQDALTERRGLRWTSRHRPLRQPSTSPGIVQLEQPSRLRVFNEEGMALYATGLLPSGQYRLDGLSAPSLPGFLQLELESLSGQRQTVLVPWVTSPLLLTKNDRLMDLELYPKALAAQMLSGLTETETLATKLLYETEKKTMLSLGLQSRRWLSHVAGGEVIGQCLHQHDCRITPRFNSRSRLGAARQLAIDLSPTHKAGQVSLRQTFNGSTNLSLQWSRSEAGDQVWLGSWSQTLTEGLSLTLSLRQLKASGRPENDPALLTPATPTNARPREQSQLFLSLQFQPKSFRRSQLRTSYSKGANLQRASVQLKHQWGTGPENAELSLRQSKAFSAEGSAADSQASLAELRTRRPEGDLSLQWRRDRAGQARTDFGLASRIWLTPRGLHLGSPGDHNLLLVDLKTPGLELSNGLQTRTSNTQGLAALTRTGAWTANRFRYNLRSLSFDQASPGALEPFAVASRRAYWLEAKAAEVWEQMPAVRLDLPLVVLQQLQSVTDAQGRNLGFTTEGHVDIARQDLHTEQLILELQLRGGPRLQCRDQDKEKRPSPDSKEPGPGAERLLRCEPLPGKTPRTTEPPPSSGSEARVQYQERPKAEPLSPS
jgi:hypothetical protein